MNKDLKLALKYLLMLALIFIALKFFLILFPFILLFMIGYIVYNKIKDNKKNEPKTKNNNNKKKLKDDIEEAEVIRETKDK